MRLAKGTGALKDQVNGDANSRTIAMGGSSAASLQAQVEPASRQWSRTTSKAHLRRATDATHLAGSPPVRREYFPYSFKGSARPRMTSLCGPASGWVSVGWHGPNFRRVRVRLGSGAPDEVQTYLGGE